jgi:RNA polymerase sigma factor (sigma-70 family)
VLSGAPMGLVGRWLVMEARAPQRATPRGVTAVQLAEAERSAWRMLAKKFSSTWIRAHISDLVGQANLEYAEWLENNPPADSPIGWLLNCVWWRALTRYESESRRPPTASLEAVVQVQDQSAPNPEGELLDHDRQERLREAISNLPEKEQKLLALVYFEDYSIREAGRMLGWGKSSADRHHTAAMEKMRSLVGERSLLSPAILGPVAWVVINDQARGALGQAWDAALAPLSRVERIESESLGVGSGRLQMQATQRPPGAAAACLATAERRRAPLSVVFSARGQSVPVLVARCTVRRR